MYISEQNVMFWSRCSHFMRY